MTRYKGTATFVLDNTDHEHEVEIQLSERDDTAAPSVRAHCADLADSILELAGPVLTCRIPSLFDQPQRCLVHTDGALYFLREMSATTEYASHADPSP